MSEALVLKAEKRQKMGTREARKQRVLGQVPAIIYGHKQDVTLKSPPVIKLRIIS